MIKVTKEEAAYIRANAHESRITLVGRHKKAHQKKRYADEMPETFRLLNKYRNETKVK